MSSRMVRKVVNIRMENERHRIYHEAWLAFAPMGAKKLNPPLPKSLLGKVGKKEITWKKYEALLYSTFGTSDYERLQGPSPGGAAAELGISRQAVHQAIERGTLDAWYVYDGKLPGLRRLRMVNVTGESIERFKKSGQRPASSLSRGKKLTTS